MVVMGRPTRGTPLSYQSDFTRAGSVRVLVRVIIKWSDQTETGNTGRPEKVFRHDS
jgi:hypothetical protein